MAVHEQPGFGWWKPGVLKIVLWFLGLGLICYILGPPLYWHLIAALSHDSSSVSSSTCPPCVCDCSAQPLLSMPEDCVKHDMDVSEDMEKNFAELLSEELKLREAEALESQRKADMALLEAKKSASQYQKEADKCNSGMETCEEAREKSEAALAAQKKLTVMWKQRALQRGWIEGAVKSR